MEKNLNVLIVDNNGISIKEIRDILESRFFTIYQLNDLADIFTYLKNIEIHLIVINQNQFLNPAENIKIIKSLNIPVLIMASLLFINLQKALNDVSHVSVLRLPKSNEEIKEKLKSLID